MAADEKVFKALGAARALMDTKGEAPAALVTALSQGPGAHIKKHVYRYTRTINRELVTIRRVKELQLRVVGLVGALLISLSVAMGSYFSTLLYDLASGWSPAMRWVAPFAAAGALLALLLLCLSARLCSLGIFSRTLGACCCSSGSRERRTRVRPI